MSRHPRSLPERVAWIDGGRLVRRDLADAIAHEARMLEMHVRNTHDTWGIANGLPTSLSADRLTVTVQPGLAYNCRGESIVLLTAMTIVSPPPSMSGGIFDLLLLPTRPASPCAPLESNCDGKREIARPVLRWSAVEAAQCCDTIFDDAVHLGRFTRGNGGKLTNTDRSRRRAVRPLRRPHVGSGVTRPGDLVWQQSAFDIFAKIDTRDAGFTTTPAYFVSIASPEPHTGQIIGPFVSVGQATRTHFNVHLFYAAKPPAFILLFAQRAFAKEFAISWTGVETAVGCTGGSSILSNVALLPFSSAFGGTP